ncbi:hypothetical protein D035_3629 [Vibrio parahaemolyticus VP250]|nr:hypothetical protein D035_3629 [Vibrio parahaemolyticus VP250]
MGVATGSGSVGGLGFTLGGFHWLQLAQWVGISSALQRISGHWAQTVG